ncbi:MAG: histidine phosphatase family protein [Planctomycetota bacterium]
MAYTASENTCIAFLVRHAATINNMARPPKIQGRGDDLGLSPEGRLQAEATARFLSDQPIAKAFSSPLSRAMETASIIGRPHGLDPAPVAQLHEVDVGRWEGCSWDEIERDEPEAYRRFMANPAEHGYAGGENLTQVQNRVLPAARELFEQQLGHVILVVGHNVVNRVLLASLLHVPIAWARGVDQDNCGVNVIRYRNGQTKVLTTNAAFHLHDLA